MLFLQLSSNSNHFLVIKQEPIFFDNNPLTWDEIRPFLFQVGSMQSVRVLESRKIGESITLYIMIFFISGQRFRCPYPFEMDEIFATIPYLLFDEFSSMWRYNDLNLCHDWEQNQKLSENSAITWKIGHYGTANEYRTRSSSRIF